MEDNKEKVVVNITDYNGEKPVEIVLREGMAAKPLEVKAPESINVSGVISTPLDWLKSRVDTINQKECHVLVDREKMEIRLTVNERDYYTKAHMVGTVEYTEVFKRLKINKLDDCWSPSELAQFIRVNRSVFSNTEQAMKMVTELKNIKIKANTEIERQRDTNGLNKQDIYRQVIDSSLPKSVRINIAIFKGTPKEEFEVEFDHYLDGGDVYLQLISPSVADSTEQFRDNCIDEVLNGIREVAPEIAIMEL